MGSYLKGIYNAILGRSSAESDEIDYDCRPVDVAPDLDEFSDRIQNEYAETLAVLAE